MTDADEAFKYVFERPEGGITPLGGPREAGGHKGYGLAVMVELLSVAQGVEHGQIINTAVPTKTTARSRRNTVIVAALIGLLLGIVAALLWEPITRVVRRPA